MNWPAAYDLSFSDDGRLLVCVGQNVVVIDLAARRRLATAKPMPNLSYAAFSPNGAALAVKSTGGRILVIDTFTGEILRDHKNQKDGEGSNVCFSSSGDKLVDGSWDGTLTIRRASDNAILGQEHLPGEMIEKITHDQNRRVWRVQHSIKIPPEENTMLPGYVSLRHWPFSPETTRIFSFGWLMQSAALSPDGTQIGLLQAFDQRRLHIARASDGQIITSSIPLGAGSWRGELVWSGDGRYIGTFSSGMFEFFRASDLVLIGRRPVQYASSLAFLPGGERLALGSWKTTKILKLSDVLTDDPQP
ncbi:WD40 repeat domain-containing protein [Kaistia algarum]|uniref:WD40 repeat domain-containing protein n=1 Tax=Kaistia algarum TaxID=2083279 RepID=UPI00105707B6|nr:WD40 repeat domain-containing protein [Kaistia algarum]MCX5516589.1 WD40 repeat domain-containing protein [Kaistia algarum]